MDSLFFDKNGKPILYELVSEFDAAYKVTRGDYGGYQVWQPFINIGGARWTRNYVPVNMYGGFVNFVKPCGGPVRGKRTGTYNRLFEKMAYTFEFLRFPANQTRERLERWVANCNEHHLESCWLNGEDIFSLLTLVKN